MIFDFRKNKHLWIYTIFVICVLAVLIVSSVILYLQIISVSNDVQAKLDEANRLISEVNKNIDSIKKVNKQIDSIKQQNNLLSNRLDNLSKKYPPEQNININNIGQKEFNNAIESAIDMKFENINRKIYFNFWFNIIIGSILTLGGLGLGIYFILKNKGYENEES